MSDLFGKTELDRELMKYSGHDCEECKHPLTIRIYQFSTQNMGRALCYKDQQKLRESKAV